MLSIGIVGMPNVGKSTLFNALTKSKQADAQNYPFCTIDPNIGVVEVPDERLQKLAEVSASKKIIPTAMKFVDIAGLVRGASKGEGKGNEFLFHIREVDAIAHVVRAFEEGNITHVENRVNPKDDADIINLELILADLQTVTKRLDNAKKRAKSVVPKELQKELILLERLFSHLEAGKRARLLDYDEDELKIMKELCLLTMKPMLYVVNVEEQEEKRKVQQQVQLEENVPHIYISAKIEAEIGELASEDAKIFMEDLGMTEAGLDRLIRAGYELLDLVTYFTSGEPETRAWTVKRGTLAPDAAGVIHTDFIKGFVKADVVNWQDFVAAGGWNKMKETGKMRLEGKAYKVQDGDVMYFHIAS